MEKYLLLIALLAILPTLVWLWVRRLRELRTTMLHANLVAKTQRLEANEKEAEAARLAFSREVFLALLTIGLAAYGLLGMGIPIIGPMIQGMQTIQGGNMTDAINVAIRVLISIGAFLLTFGLSVAFLPEVFPYARGSRPSNLLAYSIGFCLAGAFALFLGVSETAFGIVFDQLTQGFLGVITTALSILFGAIGAFLFWRQIKTTIKPK